MSFATQLRKAREKAGFTVELAAKAAGVSPRTWAHWEKGNRLPPAQRDAITRERLLASLTEAASPGSSNTRKTRKTNPISPTPILPCIPCVPWAPPPAP